MLQILLRCEYKVGTEPIGQKSNLRQKCSIRNLVFSNIIMTYGNIRRGYWELDEHIEDRHLCDNDYTQFGAQ